MNFWKKSFVAWPNEHAFDKIEVYKKKYIKYARYNNKTTNKIVSVKFRLTLKNLQFSIFFSIDAHFIYGLTYTETKCLKLIVAYNFHFRPIHFVCDPWKRVDYDPYNKTRLKNEHIYIYIYIQFCSKVLLQIPSSREKKFISPIHAFRPPKS